MLSGREDEKGEPPVARLAESMPITERSKRFGWPYWMRWPNWMAKFLYARITEIEYRMLALPPPRSITTFQYPEFGAERRAGKYLKWPP